MKTHHACLSRRGQVVSCSIFWLSFNIQPYHTESLLTRFKTALQKLNPGNSRLKLKTVMQFLS